MLTTSVAVVRKMLDAVAGITGSREGLTPVDNASMTPEASIFTLLHIAGSVDAEIEALPIRTSFAQRLPALERRYVAAWALGEIGTDAAIPGLVLALNDANSEVRRYATRALIKLNRIAVQPLIDSLENASIA